MKSRNRVLYYGKKAAAFLASVLLLSVLVFYISRLAPGDPLVSYYGAVSYTHLTLPTTSRV